MIDYIINKIFNSITYILPTINQKDCWLVDCGDVDKLFPLNLRIKGVLLTHAHFDHIYGLNKLVEKYPDAMIYTNEEGRVELLNSKLNFSHYHEADFIFQYPQKIKLVKEGDSIPLFDNVQAIVYETPGHSPSCLSFVIENNVFTGDAYIPGIKVVTSFPRSNKALAATSLDKIMNLAKEKQILPGHKILK